jgi:hypothetical protein
MTNGIEYGSPGRAPEELADGRVTDSRTTNATQHAPMWRTADTSPVLARFLDLLPAAAPRQPDA